jgi:hypothetical protein
MKQYIDKAAVVAEIERRRDLHYKYYMKNGVGSIAECKYDEDREILSFLDTIDTKEVDLEKEFDDYTKDILACDIQFEPFTHLHNCAKHFFELGLKVQKGE